MLGRWLAFAALLAVALPGAAGAATFVDGGLDQTFQTVAGQSLQVGTALGGDSDGPANGRTVLTTASGDVTQTSTFDASAAKPDGIGWQSYQYSFVAAGASTTMSFAAADAATSDAALDAVSISTVPEPAIWAMMLFGFFGLSFAVRRRDTGSKRRVRFT